MPNWIDSLWTNQQDYETENELRRLWLRFQAERKEAWDQLRVLVAGSQKLQGAAEAQIRGALPMAPNYQVEPLVIDAVDEAEKMLKDERWQLPASTRGVFVPYLRATNNDGYHHWVQRALSRHFRQLAQPGEREQQVEGGRGQ